jgi:hypothetical protein
LPIFRPISALIMPTSLLILFRSKVVICLKFVFIEMLDQGIFRPFICFRIIHFILISTVHALFLTCLPVSISGT